MRRIIILWHILLMPLLGYSQLCDFNDTIPLGAYENVEIPLVVNQGDLDNENLADPNQGLCGIEFSFWHNYYEELELTLVSPSGQSVVLTGPVVSCCDAWSALVQWNIRFVANSLPADPDPGFIDRWDNNQPNQFFGPNYYTGSYYPFSGQLENFNTGNVYGTWKLIANNEASFNSGAIWGIRLIFCDQNGLDCCFADAGRMRDDDLVTCIGDDELNYVPEISYTVPRPNENEYGYTYVVSRNDIIQSYQDGSVDLENAPAGTYQVCGLSYRLAESGQIPSANGQNRLSDLIQDLNSNSPSFCGDLTNDCREIIIGSPPPPVNIPVSICEGDSYTYDGNTYTDEGTYPHVLTSAAGCDSLVNLQLTLVPPVMTQLEATICEGDSYDFGGSSYDQPGIYPLTLVSSIGCDSIVELDLKVVSSYNSTVNEAICQGDTLTIDDQKFFTEGNFTVTIPSMRNCDSIIDLTLDILDPVIDLASFSGIDCNNPSVTLDAGNSTPAGQVTYEWQDLSGNNLGTGPTLTVDQGGEYILLLTESAFGSSCTVQETFTVEDNTSFPTADAGPDQSITCNNLVVTLGGNGTSTGSEFIYSWTTDTGNFLDPTDAPSPRVDAPGRYTLVVTNIVSNCTDTQSVDISATQDNPVAVTLPDTAISCSHPAILLTSTGSSAGADFIYEWRDDSGNVLGDGQDLSVNSGGTYELFIQNTNNGCRDSTQVNVLVDTFSPVVTIATPEIIDCDQNRIRLNATAPSLDPDVEISWSSSNGGSVVSDGNTLSPEVGAGGTYTVLLSNSRNGCETTASVEVTDIRNVQRAEPAVPELLSCGVNSVSLNIGTSSTGPDVIYQWSTSDGHFVGDPMSASVVVDAPGSYTLTVLDTVSRCSDEATVEVARDQNIPVAEAGPGFTINCQVSQDTLFGAGSSAGADILYRWSGPCLQSDPDALWVIVDCPGIYYLEVTNTGNSCTIRDSVEVLFDQELPVAAVAPVDTIDCFNTQVTLDAGPSSPSGNLSYTWTGPDISGTADGSSVTVALPGDYDLVVTNTLNFCQHSLTVNVQENKVNPTADAGPEVTLTCNDPVAQIGGPNSSTGPFFTYVWKEVEGQLPAETDAAMVPADEEGIFRLVVSDTRNGCRDSSNVIVIQDQETPGVNAGQDQELSCGIQVVSLNGSNSVQQPGIVYEWTGPCLVGRTDSIGARADCPGVYYLRLTNTNTGCTAIDSVTVGLNSAAPDAVLPDEVNIDCSTGTALLDGAASSSGLYEWTKDGQVIANGVNSLTVDETGIYYFTVSTQDQSCTDVDSVLVIRNCDLAIDILPPQRITCQNPTSVIDAGNSTGQSLSFEWMAPDAGCIISGQGSPIIEVNCGGSYTLILTNTALGLSETQTVVVEMEAEVPQAIVGPPDTLTCVKDEVVLDGSGSSSGTDIIYRWTRVSNGALIAETAVATTNVPGTFTLEVLDTLSQCSATATVRIVEFNLPVALSFGDSLIPCNQDTFVLSAFPTPLSDFYDFQWSGPGIAGGADSAAVMVDSPGLYSLTVVDRRSECQATASVNVTETELCGPCVAIATPDTITCDRPEVVLEADYCRPCTGCVLQWTTPDGNIVSGGNTLQPVVDRPGTYELRAIDQLGLQENLEVVVFARLAPPVVEAGPDRVLTCDSTVVHLGDPSQAAVDHISYSWTSPDNPAFNPSEGLLVAVSEPGVYLLEAYDTLTGCTALDSATVSIDTIRPAADAGPDRMLNCSEPSVVLDGSGSSGGNGIRYTWTGPGAGCLQAANSLNPVVSCPGTYYLVVGNTGTGCSSTDSLVVTSDDQGPVLTPLPDTAFYCGQDSIELAGNIPAPTGYTFEWCELQPNGQPAAGSCRSSLNIRVGRPGTYRFSVTDDNSGCQSSFAVEVGAQLSPPQVDAGSDRTFLCTDDSLGLQAIIGPDQAILDVQWISLNNLPINNANTLNPVIYGADSLILEVINSQTNCSAMDTVVVFQDNNAPVVDAGADTALTCLNTSINLEASGAAAGGQAPLFLWSTDDGNILSGANTSSPLIDVPGTYMLTVTDPQNGCTAVDAVTVSDLRQPPQAVITGLDSLQFNCRVDIILLDASGSVSPAGGSLDYFWTTLSEGVLDGDVRQSTIRATAAGTYRLLVTDQISGCSDSVDLVLEEMIEKPFLQIGPPQSLTCARTEVSLDATASDFGAGYVATWYNAPGDILLTDDLVLTVTEAGNYSLEIENTNNGCSTISDPVQVTLDTLPPVVTIRTPDMLDCAITSVTLDGSPSSSGPDFQYQWSTFNGTLLDDGTQVISVAGSSGVYQLEVTSSRNGCIAADSVLVEAITTPISATQLEINPPNCQNEANGSILVTEVIGGTPPFDYFLNGSPAFNGGGFGQLQSGSYTLSIRGANGCEWEETVVVPETPPIMLELGPDLTIYSGDSVTLTAQVSSEDIVLYQWEPTPSDGSTQLVSPRISTGYSLTVTDSKGCTATDRMIVLVDQNRYFFLPTAFSPNGDGSNDTFGVMTGPEVVNIRSFRIYDRWGHLVFQQQNIPPNDPILGWDGRHNGRLMNSGVFVYFIELEYKDGWIEAVKGDVTLLR